MQVKNPPLSGIIAGMDEAGRGSWAGPVVAAVVVIPKGLRLKGLDDSKKLSEVERERLFPRIIQNCPHGIGVSSHAEVDELGLLRATNLAFSRALEHLELEVEHLYIDGRDAFVFPVQHTSVIRGDQIYRCIAAASVLAKVTRDHLMVELAKEYPDYGFEIHKGYGTDRHQKALTAFGPSEVHRKSYEPIKKLQFESRNSVQPSFFKA
jgi:ribonuclease HII